MVIQTFTKELREAIYKDCLSFHGYVARQVSPWLPNDKYIFQLADDFRVTIHGFISPIIEISTKQRYGWVTTPIKLAWWKRIKLAWIAPKRFKEYDARWYAENFSAAKAWGHQPTHMEKKLSERYGIHFE